MNTRYIYTFGLIMTILVALALAGSTVLLGPIAKKNEDIFNKRQILEAIAKPLEQAGKSVASLSDQEVLDIFDKQVEQAVVTATGEKVEGMKAIEVDMAKERKKPEAERVYPVYEVSLDGKAFYIFSVRGSGLWDAIWGNIALEEDLNTVAGVSFDHAGETPGLGAEIKDNASWKAQFVGKKIYDGDKYVSVNVRKGGAIDKEHEVDGLSGATVTADGVSKMLYEGLQAYQPYMEEADGASKK
ncbi:NADH:ubiquinone reductase (Na(+)-transporting) subunit C [Neolewinella lacunae]|uniref:Na(+)-translocating NADH-quinone reductase subunit C n=1 Tax=Neolewinella lacunae TaxID=1517758 RepID=A0A923PNL1_9BACT|nr:NADH:ubiquinone reductase (Na(+)-transporting) subunit C [Neolewinella lacunae]MBC6995720.1 NADH:ubiquinone reductase (Na(+)-transporting) subunit C [Neolewinella lacunae]MDN3636587.1 NADH:ubiquinone reductase (Na(+)-transporting) subunit C [Neolewinella lacunae]